MTRRVIGAVGRGVRVDPRRGFVSRGGMRGGRVVELPEDGSALLFLVGHQRGANWVRAAGLLL